MSSQFRNAIFVELPTIINKNGKYKTRRGEIINIYKIVDGPYGAVGEHEGGAMNVWDISGRLFSTNETQADIVEAIDD